MTTFVWKRSAQVLLCGAVLATMPVLAQNTTEPAQPAQNDAPPPMGGPRGGGPGRRMEMLQRDLNLSADQTAQVKAILEAERTKAEALRSNSSLAPDDRRTQMMSLRKDTDAKIRALLTPDQVTKFDAMQARMHERMQGRGGPDGPPPPPPPGGPQQ